MKTAFRPEFEPFAKEGQLLGLLSLGTTKPERFFRVISVEPVPQLLITVAANADNERQTTLEVGSHVLAQWRFNVVTANARVVVRRPRGARSYGTGGGGQGFVADTVDTDWGTEIDRALTEFFFLGGEQDEVRFDEINGTAGTDTRVAGWKHYLEGTQTQLWTMRNPGNLAELIDVDPKQVPERQLHLLENFAGIVPLFLTRG